MPFPRMSGSGMFALCKHDSSPNTSPYSCCLLHCRHRQPRKQPTNPQTPAACTWPPSQQHLHKSKWAQRRHHSSSKYEVWHRCGSLQQLGHQAALGGCTGGLRAPWGGPRQHRRGCSRCLIASSLHAWHKLRLLSHRSPDLAWPLCICGIVKLHAYRSAPLILRLLYLARSKWLH